MGKERLRTRPELRLGLGLGSGSGLGLGLGLGLGIRLGLRLGLGLGLGLMYLNVSLMAAVWSAPALRSVIPPVKATPFLVPCGAGGSIREDAIGGLLFEATCCCFRCNREEATYG